MFPTDLATADSLGQIIQPVIAVQRTPVFLIALQALLHKDLLTTLTQHTVTQQTIQEDQATIQEDQATIQEDQATIQEDQATIQEDQATIQEDQATINPDPPLTTTNLINHHLATTTNNKNTLTTKPASLPISKTPQVIIVHLLLLLHKLLHIHKAIEQRW